MAQPKDSRLAQVYHDDPSIDAVSMHTTRSDYEYDDAAEPPSYADSEAAASSSTQLQPNRSAFQHTRTFVDSDPYTAQSPSTFPNNGISNVSSGSETTFRMDNRLSDPDSLETYVKAFLTEMPPRPLIRIYGQHTEERYNASNKKNERERITDFNITLSLQPYLNPEFRTVSVATNGSKVHRGSWRRTRAIGHSQDIEVGGAETLSLQDWCRDFCNNKSYLKTFRVQREVAELQEEYLRSRIESIIRATHYHGHLGISFPIHDKNIDIYNPHWVNRARVSWIRWIFYVTFLWTITWPILFFMTKRWTVYNVQWQWARWGQERGQPTPRKSYASIDEEEWAKRHTNLIQMLALEKFEGDASHFPTHVPDERVQQGVTNRLPSPGNPNVEAAVGFIQSGVTAWNGVQGRTGRPLETWGGDSY